MRWTSLPNPEKCSTLSSGVPYVFFNFWPVFASGTLVWTWWSGCGLGRWLNQCQLCANQQLLKTPQQGLGKGNGCPRAPEIFNRVAGAFEAAPRSGHWALQMLQTRAWRVILRRNSINSMVPEFKNMFHSDLHLTRCYTNT